MSASKRSRILLALLLAGSTSAALAQKSIYRCGSSYGTTPCDGAQVIQPVAAPSPAQQQAARSDAAAAKTAGDTLERERLQAEAAQQREAAAARQAQAQRIARDREAERRAHAAAQPSPHKKKGARHAVAGERETFAAFDRSSLGQGKKKKKKKPAD
jgi:hypothetical protein